MKRFLSATATAGDKLLPTLAVIAAGALTIAADRQLLLHAQELPPYALGPLLDGSGFVPIPAGEFLMGTSNDIAAEGPPHRVRISTSFEMSKFEVTQSQWAAVMGTAHPSREPARGVPAEPAAANNPSHFTDPRFPVENVSWNDVQRFLVNMNARDTKHVYRLPTEAEWEYASGGGTAEGSVRNLGDIAWFKPNSGDETHPVGQKAPSAWGLYDMQGNVSEWVQDWFGSYPEGSLAIDPRGPESGSYRVYRGCGWFSPAADCRSAFRAFNFPTDGYYNVGFRLVRIVK